LACYLDSTTIGGNPGLTYENDTVTINGNLYVSGTTFSSNNVVYENTILSIGTSESEKFTRGVLITDPDANVMISYTNVLTIGYTHGAPNDVNLFPIDKDIHLEVLGNVSAKNFFGDAINLKNTTDILPGTYGDCSNVPMITVDSSGRPSSIDLVSVRCTSLEEVTHVGNSTSRSIRFENAETSLVTSGNIGVANSNPTALLCVGEGVQI
jgi:hypothetical protein